ncbi:interleukin-12 receptor subunit beta-2 [Gracilinanus agilis]|uniref:interleukin-12 receptor subunit beta-2 n=1 Tax=Gracilinanus agilis TaxID=191870 RepID=UPI001CFC885F|nr:interleukin-12 receptor subunit beta-2 [Gracilinanus agilis]
MAHAAGGYSAALILFITWLLMKAEIDVCKRGDVKVSPACEVPLGTPVWVSCSLKANRSCSPPSDFQKLILYQKGQRLSTLNRLSSLNVQVSDLHLGTTLFRCTISCGGHEEDHVCGKEVSVGLTPEQPQNLSCGQLGARGTVACTWAKGRETHVYTEYTLRLTGPSGLHLEKRGALDHDDFDLGISLSPDSPDASYTARVMATNSLGNSSSSLPFVFSFVDVVKPLPPSGVRADFPNMAANFCALQWQDPGPVMLNRLQFRPVNGSSWEMVHVTNAGGRYNLYNLKPFTEYEFQIASKFHPIKGKWSDWSELWRTQTPEEEPVGMLDVWYTQEDLEGGLQRISLFWKNMSVAEARGTILRYQVVVREMPSSAELPTLKNSTVHKYWTTEVPQKDYAAAVSAVNSKGCSPPAWIFIPRQPREAPRDVLAQAQGTHGIRLTWEPPGPAAAAVKEYLVEWKEPGAGGNASSAVHWLRQPPGNTSAMISGNEPAGLPQDRQPGCGEPGKPCQAVSPCSAFMKRLVSAGSRAEAEVRAPKAAAQRGSCVSQRQSANGSCRCLGPGGRGARGTAACRARRSALALTLQHPPESEHRQEKKWPALKSPERVLPVWEEHQGAQKEAGASAANANGPDSPHQHDGAGAGPECPARWERRIFRRMWSFLVGKTEQQPEEPCRKEDSELGDGPEAEESEVSREHRRQPDLSIHAEPSRLYCIRLVGESLGHSEEFCPSAPVGEGRLCGAPVELSHWCQAHVHMDSEDGQAAEAGMRQEEEAGRCYAPDWNFLVVPITAALIMVGILSVPRIRAKVMSVLSTLKPQWYNQEIPDPANSMWAKKFSIIEGDIQFHLDDLSNNCWTISEDPETLEIKEVLQRAAPTLQETCRTGWPRHPNFLGTEGESWLLIPKPPNVGAERGAAQYWVPGTGQAERGKEADPYKAMGSGGPASRAPKAGEPASRLGDVPASGDYLPSNLDDVPSVAADPLEEGELQGLSFSVFPKGSFLPLLCGEKLTLDRVKIRSGPAIH